MGERVRWRGVPIPLRLREGEGECPAIQQTSPDIDAPEGEETDVRDHPGLMKHKIKRAMLFTAAARSAACRQRELTKHTGHGGEHDARNLGHDLPAPRAASRRRGGRIETMESLTSARR